MVASQAVFPVSGRIPEKKQGAEPFPEQHPQDCLFQQIRKKIPENKKESNCSGNLLGKTERYHGFP